MPDDLLIPVENTLVDVSIGQGMPSSRMRDMTVIGPSKGDRGLGLCKPANLYCRPTAMAEARVRRTDHQAAGHRSVPRPAVNR